ncbi:hypothetical protein IPC1387_35030 [Pseudomonas aeruginosa]|nr:hypothetical protein IPC1387_35030 [Pseudomonas aeruginosa]
MKRILWDRDCRYIARVAPPLLAVLALAGCMTMPDVERPRLATPHAALQARAATMATEAVFFKVVVTVLRFKLLVS